jgi:NAD(P)-dependent dehydrogenase (short-subunit alcohol dehydrogenase family)
MDSAWTMTKPFHRAPYSAISPLRPELNQTGKTVLVSGGNDGIGYAIAKAFLQASAHKVIVLGRRPEPTKQAAIQLAPSNPHAKVVGLTCDVSSNTEVDQLWDTLEQENTTVDVLVLNAAKISEQTSILEIGTEGIWKDFNMNVRAQLQMTERFYNQKGQGTPGPKVRIELFKTYS